MTQEAPAESGRFYSCSRSAGVLAITWGINAFIGGLLVLIAAAWVDMGPAHAIIGLVCMAPAVLFFAVARAYAPKGYVVTDHTLRIVRLFNDAAIELSAIRRVEGPDPTLVKRSWQICGSGGYYGMFGTYQNKRLGAYEAYATRTHTVILLETARGTKYVLSPDEPILFLDDINRRKPLKVQGG